MGHKAIFVTGIASLLFLIGCGGGGDGGGNGFPPEADAQTTSEDVTVTVSNDPLNVNITNTSLPLTVTTEPLTVTVTTESRQVIGLDETCYPGSGDPSVVYTVPSGYTFILTDVAGLRGEILRRIGSTSKTILPVITVAGSDGESHFQSGYDFPPGSQILFKGGTGAECVYISGYLIAS